MPANLTPDYLAAEARFRAAETTDDKLAALDEMYATIPKHKGTEKLRADIKRRVSKLREKGKRSQQFDEFHVVRQGAGQIVLVGPPNSGKSSLLARLTSAEPEIAEHPGTTRYAMPGMMEFEDITIQLVDLPPVAAGLTENGVASLARGADAVAVVLDASEDALLDHFEEIRDELSKSRLVLVGEGGADREYPAGTVARPTLVIANKLDAAGAAENADVLRESYGDEFDIRTISTKTGDGLEDLRIALFGVLGIVG